MNDQAAQLREWVRSSHGSESDGGAGLVSILPQSILKGAVSYRPVCTGRSAATPWHQRNIKPPQNRRVDLAKAIAVSSGKGGVGKSNLAVNLAVAMSGLGLRVCLLDADLGLANADVLCNLSPRVTLEQVVLGQCRLADAMLLAPGGFRLIPGASGVARMADLEMGQRQHLLEQLQALERAADVILIDCGAGISSNVVGFAAAAHRVVVTTTPEPTAITDGYGMIKSLWSKSPLMNISLVVNMAYDDHEGQGVFNRINRVCRTFLNRSLEFGATIPNDPAVPLAVRQRIPFVLHAPDCRATTVVRHLAATLMNLADSQSAPASEPQQGFISRLAIWLGIIEEIE